ncbi:uncharacterized protein LOC114342180 isoform X2 [Diabrotica virgifera virgifera]|uniref:Uncharacterized protein n=1 Tax=Diabrotica virgifera virgifera TaxID=50390 RepID=A0ABM5JNP3_DIAVI|nr:uncharacterized protein LOC114342180 isoform X2 [Diabrotica virgifera virgifera]
MSKQPKGTEKALRVQQCARWERLFSDIANRAKKNASECQFLVFGFTKKNLSTFLGRIFRIW